jgi:hypothetical protein
MDATAPRCPFHCGELIFENRFGIVEQTANQSAFAIIDAATGDKAQKLVLRKLYSFHC